MQGDRHREGLRLPRLAENRALRIARNARHGIGRAAGKRGVDTAHSGRLEIGLERIDRDLEGRVGVRSPKLLCFEGDRVEPLGIVALFDRHRVRKRWGSKRATIPTGSTRSPSKRSEEYTSELQSQRE